jgi:hypothetical protein
MKQRVLKPFRLVIVGMSLLICLQGQVAQPKAKAQNMRNPIFLFHTDEFWLNLHHFLYVLGRAENKEPDAAREAVAGAPADQERGLKKLNASEQTIWRQGVAAYAGGPSKKDIVFDDHLSAATNVLVGASDAKSLSAIKVDPALATILEKVAPIYRKAWWREHHESNRKWQKTIQYLVDQHGAKVLAFITNAYKLQWPASGFPVHVSAYTNWSGAYSTTGNLLVLSSLDPSGQGAYGLETVFHEAMHQWDDQMTEALRAEAIKLKKSFPRGLSHSLLFFTAGEAMRRAIPGHVPYAEKFGVWKRGWESFKLALEETWKPYLEGQGIRDEALAALLKRTALEPPKK